MLAAIEALADEGHDNCEIEGGESRGFHELGESSNLLFGIQDPRQLVVGHVGNAPVHTYIAAQAAISSHVFDRSTTAMIEPDPAMMPNVYGYYWQSGASSWPTQWQTDERPSYMNSQYMPALLFVWDSIL